MATNLLAALDASILAAAEDFVFDITSSILNDLMPAEMNQEVSSSIRMQSGSIDVEIDDGAQDIDEGAVDQETFSFEKEIVEIPQDELQQETTREPQDYDAQGYAEVFSPADQAETIDGFNAYYEGYPAQLEATISGGQLGFLLASSDFNNYAECAQTLTVEVDEASVAALYAIAGVTAYLDRRGDFAGNGIVQQQEQQLESWAFQSSYWENQQYMQQQYMKQQQLEGQQMQALQQQHLQMYQQQNNQQQQLIQQQTLQQQLEYQQLEQQQYRGWSRQVTQQDSQLVAPAEAVFKSHEEAGEDGFEAEETDRPTPTFLNRQRKQLDTDLIVVTTKGGVPAARTGKARALPNLPTTSNFGPEQKEARRMSNASPEESNLMEVKSNYNEDIAEEEEEEEAHIVETSGLQVHSAHLLQQLGSAAGTVGMRLTPSQGLRPRTNPTSLPPASRPGTCTHLLHGSRPHTVSGLGLLTADRKRSPQTTRPEWNTSFTAATHRRIPQYDALLDEHCATMTSPEKLRHIIQTRELPDSHLHIVRARFEQRRRRLNTAQKLPVEHTNLVEPSLQGKDKATLSDAPTRIVDRIAAAFNTDLGFQNPISLTDFMSPVTTAGSAKFSKSASALVCSPDWANSTLHQDIMDGTTLRLDTNVIEPTTSKAGSLSERYEKLRELILTNWHRMQIPLDIKTNISSGPLEAITPDNLYQLEVHLKELKSYEASTKDLIHAWLERQSLLESVVNTHALGVNDARLASLKADLQKLNKFGSDFVFNVSHWASRFAPFIVDMSRDLTVSGQSGRPRPLFVWSGCDCIQKVQSESAALSRGDVKAIKGYEETKASEIHRDLRGAAGNGLERWSEHLDDWGFANSPSPPCGNAANAIRAQKAALQVPCPLVASAMASQTFNVSDVLFQGPAPSWYRKNVAKAGLKALKRSSQ